MRIYLPSEGLLQFLIIFSIMLNFFFVYFNLPALDFLFFTSPITFELKLLL